MKPRTILDSRAILRAYKRDLHNMPTTISNASATDIADVIDAVIDVLDIMEDEVEVDHEANAYTFHLGCDEMTE